MDYPLLIQRVGVIRNPDPVANTCEVEYLDRTDDEPIETAILPQPYASGEIGIYAVPPDGTMCIVGRGYMNQPIILGLLNDPLNTTAQFQGGAGILSSNFVTVPLMNPGELVIKGAGTTATEYTLDGNISNVFGNSKQVFDSGNIHTLRVTQEYKSTSSGYSVSGDIYREKHGIRKGYVSVDRLTDADYDKELNRIGRNSLISVSDESGRIASTAAIRNPALTEHREVVFEFSRDAGVVGPKTEAEIYKDFAPNAEVPFADTRQATRTNAFDLGPATYNTLIERINGTAVDISGNVLDLNRKVISFENKQDDLVSQLTSLRRSIKMHLELNARKESAEIKSTDTDGVFAGAPSIAANHSRWYVDVDAEGQTKVNIPASSSSGNIPLHVRYLTGSADNEKYEGKTEPTDIKHIAYGDQSRGIPVAESYAPAISVGAKNKDVRWSTPYHDITFADITESKVLVTDSAGIDSTGASLPFKKKDSQPMSDIVGDAFLTAETIIDAAGRSLWVNMDGSLELAVGADKADLKSITLDTAGSIVGRVGQDYLGNSVSLGVDGKIVLMSGMAEGSNKAGGFKLVIQNQNENGQGVGVSILEFQDGNIYIKSAPGKNIILESGNNLILDAKSNVIINGESIGHFGKHSADGAKVAPERRVPRSGDDVR